MWGIDRINEKEGRNSQSETCLVATVSFANATQNAVWGSKLWNDNIRYSVAAFPSLNRHILLIS